jgi:hypothetical protein
LPPDRRDPSEDAPTPELDPAVEAQVRALLANAPEPGPMPDGVSDRISAAIADEARLRIDRGPLATALAEATPDLALGGDVVRLQSRAKRPRPAQLAAAVAAAVVVVAAGASALHLTQRPNGAAIVGDTMSSSVPPTSGTTTGTIHIQLSTTAYDATNLATRARELLDHPGAAVPDLGAESTRLGLVATPIGLASCLSALGVADPAAVTADLATFEGRPAAVVVVTRQDAHTAWAVERSCRPGQPGILQDATPVP